MEGLQNDHSNMNEKDIMKVIAEAQLHEQQAYEAFCAKFDLQFPMPERAAVKLMNAIGWQFISICVQSSFAIILAALRTAAMFFEAAAGNGRTLQWAEAIAAVGAIELGVVILAAIKAEIQNSKTELEDLKAAARVDVRLLWTGIVACVAISIIAGLGVSFEGFGVNVNNFKTALAYVMGAGASLVAWVSGDILGAMLARFNNASTLARLVYQQEVQERENKKNAMWEAAPERSIARTELVELKEYLAATRFKKARVPRQQKVETPRQPQEESKPRTDTDVRQKVFDYLDRIWQSEARVAGPSELKRETGASKSHCSETLIPDWRATREIPVNEPVPAEERSNGHEG
jgi:hypothetical protein